MSHILVIGATGAIGLEFIPAALTAGHELTLYVRNPSKIPAEFADNPKVHIIEGTLDDAAGLATAAASGAKVFVSFAGPTAASKGTPVTDGLKVLWPLLVANGFERALVLGTCSFPAPEDKGALKWKMGILLIKVIGGSAYQEFNGLGAFVAAQPAAPLKWTLARVPLLLNGEAKEVTPTFTGSGQDGITLTRKSIVAWVLKEIGSEEWVGKCPVLCNN